MYRLIWYFYIYLILKIVLRCVALHLHIAYCIFHIAYCILHISYCISHLRYKYYLFQFGCDECLNGEKMIWDPVRPLGCKCPKRGYGYVGQICEKCKYFFEDRRSGRKPGARVLNRLGYLHPGSKALAKSSPSIYTSISAGAWHWSIVLHCAMGGSPQWSQKYRCLPRVV